MLLKDIFINYLKTDLDKVLVLTSIFMIPSLCKIFWGITIDARLIEKRKHYLVVFGLISTVAQIWIGFNYDNMGVLELSSLVFIINFCSSFSDIVLESIVVQQARRDMENG
jgi:hypothetical protein